MKTFTLNHTVLGLTTLMKRAMANIVGKGENSGKQHFVLDLFFFKLFFKNKSINHLQMLSFSTSQTLCRLAMNTANIARATTSSK